MKYFLVVSLLLLGCDDGCEKEEMKCEDNVVMICNDRQKWEKVSDCDDGFSLESEEQLNCCKDSNDGFLGCLPVEYCEK